MAEFGVMVSFKKHHPYKTIPNSLSSNPLRSVITPAAKQYLILMTSVTVELNHIIYTDKQIPQQI